MRRIESPDEIEKTLAHYRVTAKLGEGGVAEVYRAEDTKPGREVLGKDVFLEMYS